MRKDTVRSRIRGAPPGVFGGMPLKRVKPLLLVSFGAILLGMALVTGWASQVQPVWQWGGLRVAPDRAWTIATLCDAYCGFLTFYVWVLYKERRSARRLAWFVAIMALGNMAMAAYVLKELWALRADESMAVLLTRTNP
jgi:Protein of unknown function (DUF1475)